MITTNQLMVRSGGTDYGYYLHTDEFSNPGSGVYIHVVVGNRALICPLTTGSSHLHVRINGTDYGAQNFTPVINFEIYASSSSAAYTTNWSVSVRNLRMSNNVTVDYRQILQVRATGGSTTNTWQTLATLNAGAISAGGNSISFSQPGNSLSYRILFASVQEMTTGNVALNGWRSFSYSIPYYYWSGSFEK